MRDAPFPLLSFSPEDALELLEKSEMTSHCVLLITDTNLSLGSKVIQAVKEHVKDELMMHVVIGNKNKGLTFDTEGWTVYVNLHAANQQGNIRADMYCIGEHHPVSFLFQDGQLIQSDNSKSREVTKRCSTNIVDKLLKVGYNAYGFEFQIDPDGGIARSSCEGEMLAIFVDRYRLRTELHNAYVWGSYNETSRTWSGIIGMVWILEQGFDQ